ncbi:sensor domain-containing protein [Streptomyces sp. MMG1121]|uniref:sensor domain-containing protein n=1 Tax=Streptomyces sp. MMG1121 TaxID=1415544 RepID=UPI003B6329AD
MRDPAVRKDLPWLVVHTVPGTPLCAAVPDAWGQVVNWPTAPVWWRLAAAGRDAIIPLGVDSWGKAIAALCAGIGFAVAAAAVTRPLTRAHAAMSRRLLTARPPREQLAE